MDLVKQNLRFALRSLRKSPGFTAVVLLTLALGIGANTAIFSVVRAVLLAPLPYPEAERIVRVWAESQISVEHSFLFESEPRSFAALSTYGLTRVSLTGDGKGRPEQLTAIRVTPDHFAVMGVEPALGRGFTAEERQVGRDLVAVLSHRLWQRRFGGDRDLVGSTVALDGGSRTVVGVLPEGYRPLDPECDVWLPLAAEPGTEAYSHWWVYGMIARLAPQVTVEEAGTDLRRVIQLLRERVPDLVGSKSAETASVTPLLDQLVGDVRPKLRILAGAVALVLLIACGNVANLLLARSTARRRELAVRGALGAGRGHLLAQLLTESALLALGGALLGLFAAAWSVSALVEHLASSLPRSGEVALDGGVLAFALAVSLASGLLFGLLPAWRSSRPDLRSGLQSGGRGTSERHRLHSTLVAAEIALSVVLVIGASLLVKSFWQLRQVDPGFDPANLLTFRVQPPQARYDDDEKRRAYYEEVRDRIAAVPGVASAAGINLLPMAGGEIAMPYLTSPRDVPTDEPAPITTFRMVTPDLMETLGVPLVRGRQLTASDRADLPPVGLVNRALAKKAWGEEDAVGKKLYYDDGSVWFTVVGVVGDIRQQRLHRPSAPQVYMSVGQQSWASSMSFAVASEGASLSRLLPAVEDAVWSVDADVPITRVAWMDDVVRRSMTDERQLAALFSLFAVLAFVLGAVGVASVAAYTVSRRTHETGVRLALGATGASVVRTHVARLMVPVVLGLGAGLAISWGATRLLESLLHEVRATDPSVFLSVVAVLAGFAAVAAWLPARRAARVDPVAVLGAD